MKNEINSPQPIDKKLSILNGIYKLQSREIDFNVFLKKMCVMLADIVESEGVSLLMWDGAKNNLRFREIYSADENIEKELKGQILQDSSGISKWCFQNEKPVIVNEPSKDPRFNKKFDIDLNYQTKNMVCAPVFLKKKCAGVFQAVNKTKNREFTKDDYELITAVANILSDFLEKREAYKEILNKEKLSAIGQVAANVAHEIRNPIGSISGFAEMLLNSVSGSEKEYIAIILNECGRLNNLIGDILSFSKPRAVNIKKINLKTFFNEAIKEFHAGIKEDINLKIVCAADIEISADENQFKQVILNLYKNSYNAFLNSGKEGKLKIETRARKAGKIIIEIMDNGPGINEEDIEKVFVPFFSKTKGGTGLGLSICRNIIESMGGKIYAAENKAGALFKMEFEKE